MEEENCKSLLGALSDYIDGTAQEELCREIERHLAGCDNCRIVVDTLKKTVYLYQSSTDISLPQAVRERLFKRLNMDEFLKAN
jgi:predicted anti-sigma-YlaC factor YlaD